MLKAKKNLLILLAICCTFVSSIAFAANPDTPHINVSATASMEVAPDIAAINFDVNGKGTTSSIATNDAAAKMDIVRRTLLGCNILNEDITTNSYTLYPNTDSKGKVIGYTTRNNLTIKVSDITKIGTIIGKLSSAGIDKINNVSFDVKNKNLYRNKLLAQAVENARQEAAVVANAGGRTLGKLLSANLNSYNNYPHTYGNIMLKAAANEGAVQHTTLAAENITISANVETVFIMQ